MGSKSRSHKSYIFGGFRLDTAELMLYRGENEVSLPPKAIETLLALVERRGQIVSKDELMGAIWSDAVVEESNLSRYIHLLRTTLGKHADGRPMIETFRRRGYRFNGEVEVLPADGFVEIVPNLWFPGAHAHGLPVTGRAQHGRSGNVVAIAERLRPAERHDDYKHLPSADDHGANEARAGNSRRPLLIVSAAVLGVLALAGAIFYFVSFSPAKLSDKDLILIANFENRTGDAVFDETLKQGLAMQLQQSPFLSLFSDARIRETLQKMKRSADEPISKEIAREICIRQGIKAFISGSIVSFGNRYVLTVEAVNALSGEVLASEQREADGKEGVLRALSSMATSLRGKLGESLVSIEKLGTPLDATTSSLDALSLYTGANTESNYGRFERAAILLKRAVEIDPEFAMAHMALGFAYHNGGQRNSEVEEMQRAYDLRDSVSEVERFAIEDAYHHIVTAEIEKRIELLTIYKQLYPRDGSVYARLADLNFFLGNYEAAIPESVTAIGLGVNNAFLTLISTCIALDRYDEAAQVAITALDREIDFPDLPRLLLEIGAATGNEEWTRKGKESYLAKNRESEELFFETRAAIFSGELARSEGLYKKAMLAAKEKPNDERIASFQTRFAKYMAFGGSCRQIAEADRGIKLNQRPPMPAFAATAFAWCGDKARSAATLKLLLEAFPNGTFQNRLIGPTVNAILAIREGKPQEALASLEGVPSGFESKSGFVIGTIRGNAYLKLGNGTEAAKEFEKILSRRGEDLLSPLFPQAYLGLARAKALNKDIEGSHAAYEQFFDIWKNADNDLPDLVAARAEYKLMKK